MRVALALVFSILLAGFGKAGPAAKALSRDLVGAPAARAEMVVISIAVDAGRRIDARNSAYGANLSPALSWTPVDGAKSYAVILEDPDAPSPRPWGHWLIWNIPGAAASLPGGVPSGARPSRPSGAAQGRGDAGEVGYFGPHPPSGTPHYHFEVFALDRTLALAGGADRNALLAAMRGHVLALGELVATFTAPPR